MSAPRPDVTGIILAGGRSRRFGAPKAAALLGGRPLLDWTRAGLERHCARLAVVTAPGRPVETDLEVWEDLIPGKGVLGGIYTALKAAETPRVFVAGCDLPFLADGVFDRLIERVEGGDLAVPKGPGGHEPLRAIYGKACVPAILEAISADDLQVDHFFGRVRAIEVPEEVLREADPELLSFLNVNTPDDLARAEALVAAGRFTPPA